MYSFAPVTITLNDVNDNPPQFYGNADGVLSPFTIPYSLATGTLLDTLIATDPDLNENGVVSRSTLYYVQFSLFLLGCVNETQLHNAQAV